MKHKTKFRMLLFALVLAGSSVSCFPVEAGSSAITIDESSYQEKLNSALWNNPDGDVVLENGALVFTESSTDETRLITKSTAKQNEKNKNLVNASATMQFASLPTGLEVLALENQEKVEAEKSDAAKTEPKKPRARKTKSDSEKSEDKSESSEEKPKRTRTKTKKEE